MRGMRDRLHDRFPGVVWALGRLRLFIGVEVTQSELSTRSEPLNSTFFQGSRICTIRILFFKHICFNVFYFSVCKQQ